MIDTKLQDGSFSGTIPSMMKKVGLKLNTIVTSHSQDQEALSKLSDRGLGNLYDPVKDLVGVKFTFPAKKRTVWGHNYLFQTHQRVVCSH